MSSEQFDNFRIALAMNLRRLRKLKGYKADDIAELLGMTTRNYYYFENVGPKGTMPSSELLPILASYFGVTLDELFGMSQPRMTHTEQEAIVLGYMRKMSPEIIKSFMFFTGSLTNTRNSQLKIEKLTDLIRLMS